MILLKTPCAADAHTSGMKSRGISGTSGTLAQELEQGYAERVRRLPTQTTSGFDAIKEDRGKMNPHEVVGTRIGMKLQPAFVEWMMGYPIGWTDLRDSATP